MDNPPGKPPVESISPEQHGKSDGKSAPSDRYLV